ncbi:MAG: hypothetical protein QNJ90_04615 [Planctomycetota bacterium]|nr:hypothetical protein [Planctomycetota bacterium]
MTTTPSFFGSLIRRALRHRWIVLVPIATCVLPATIYALRLPETWEAMALVHVRVVRPEHIGRGLPEEREALPEEMLATVRDRLLAREPVEAAAPILFPDESLQDPDTLDGVRGAFTYEQKGTSAFGVSLTAPTSGQAHRSTNALVRAFLESERATRLRRAQSKLTFHEGELETANKDYAETLVELDALRNRNAASLPERKDVLQNELQRIATEIASQDVLIAGARTRIQTLDDQLATLDTAATKTTPQTTGAAEEALRLQLGEAQKALNSAQTELAKLRSRYTEEWPDVIRLRAAVEVHKRSVQEAIDALEKVRRQARGEAGRTAVRLLEARRKNLLELRKTAAEDIATAERRKTTSRARSTELQGHLDRIPQTEALLRPHQRKLEQVAAIVEARGRDVAAAGAAVGFYRSGDVSDVTGYRVDAWATEPTQPVGPVRWRFLATALVVGALIAYGLILLRRRIESTRVEEVEDVTDLFPDAVVVGMPDVGGRPRPRRGGFPVGEVVAAVYVVGCFGLTVLAVAAHRGWEGAPEWLRSLVTG